ncbi:cysteine desulfurase family protein [Rhodocyclus gracilis]|uniref:cysteine desulfurase n=1 Tax=Rhodocyclus tenuis TaxID=1066 RepID=A0A6L5JU60_RHOTE|nr:cysteine desulfurase family protein [Rhodocyclus gracilis]MQY50923.1 aminotransferase class V-fold PLP-dependent enzyme [Rhodocyclus gracilis]
MFAPVYFDHNATTPLDPVVREAMLPYLGERFGNASARHEYGRNTRRALDLAREQVATAVGAEPDEVVFVSGGSEANNLFLKGTAARLPPGLLAVSAAEHPSVLRPAAQLARQGWDVRHLAPAADGRLARDDWQATLALRPALVSVMLANNETGVLQDVAALAAQACSAGAIFHTDAVQALGRVPLNFRELNAAGVGAMTISGHKIGGPQGAAALIRDRRIDIEPQIGGGGQEGGLRSGTENIAALVGFGLACERAVARRAEGAAHLDAMRRRLESALADLGATVFGAPDGRLPNTSYFALPGIDGETLVARLDRAGFAVASGSACSSNDHGPSATLLAMGVDADLARGAVRVSLGTGNTERQIDDFVFALKAMALNLRRLGAVALSG